jgi:ribosomal protein S18 acetylase RimI-like enzyme
MNAASIYIRQLAPADAEIYRDIRLDALTSNPEAFGATFEVENARPSSWFAERLSKSRVFGAFRDSELLGVAGFFIQEGLKQAHKGGLWGMYVRPHARQAGIGRRLAEAVIEVARKQVELIQLTVVSDNQEARRLYGSLGFVEYGVEKNGLKQNGRYYDEILMAKNLLSNSNKAPKKARK